MGVRDAKSGYEPTNAIEDLFSGRWEDDLKDYDSIVSAHLD